jgi:uncharacterized protein (UPF0210 family)
MKIRAITLGIDQHQGDKAGLDRSIRSFFTKANTMFAEQEFESRTQRIALSPFVIAGSKDSQNARSSIERMSVLCEDSGIRWFCVPFHAVRQDMTKINDVAVDVVRQYKNAFINHIVTENGFLDRKALLYASSFIRTVSQLTNNGFDNFRCGTTFNCKPNGAFFPFTHHCGPNGFSIALELVPLCVEIIRNNQNKPLEEIRTKIIDGFLPLLKQVDKTSLRIEETTAMKYFGTDISLAPHPEHPEHSVAYIVELLGAERFGSNGTAFITSFLTDIMQSLIKRSGIRSTGFNGVMYSILEDPRLGVLSSELENLSVDSLLVLAAMCGCGIDMVPLPGDTSAEEIASIMLDIAAIAIRLKKPLGVRLLPIPGKVAGQLTDFDHDFLQNTRIQKVKYCSCPGSLFDADNPFSYVS